MIPLQSVLLLAGVLFALSVAGIFLNRKNVILLLMCIELMLLAVNFNFVAFARQLGDLHGQVFVFFIMTVAAAESAIGLAILVVLFRERQQHQRRRAGHDERLSMIQESILLTIVLAPLIAAIVAGLGGRVIGRAGAHSVTILGVAVSFALSVYVLKQLLDGAPIFDGSVYTWLVSDGIRMEVGFLVDRLTALMMVVVTFVSLCVHVYTIGYMHDDPGYQRFFSYISLFTFSMLMLVMSNNFLQLFFGWEAVGVVSYLLIGFWYTRPSAIFANLKAFLVNRVGDFGFVLGIAGDRLLHGLARLLDGVRSARRDRGRHDADLPGRGVAGDDGRLHLPVHRRDGQVGAGAAARVAAGFDGRSDADLGADPRGDDGDRRHLHGRAHVAAVRAVGDGAEHGAVHRRDDRVLHGPARHRQQRHQARRRVLDAFAARLHDGGARRFGVLPARSSI